MRLNLNQTDTSLNDTPIDGVVLNTQQSKYSAFVTQVRKIGAFLTNCSKLSKLNTATHCSMHKPSKCVPKMVQS